MLIGVDVTCFGGIEAGVSRYLREMLTGMMAASPEDDYVLYSPMPVEVPLSPGMWRPCFRTGRFPLLPGRWARDVYPRMIAQDRLDVFWGQNAILPLQLARPCPRVLTVHDVAALLYPRTLYFRNRFSWKRNFRAAVRAADLIVAVSHATARLVRDLLGVPGDRVTVIHEGCSSRLRPVQDARALEDARKQFGLPDRFILTVGTLEPRKDHATLLAAMRLRDGFPLLAVVGAVGWKSRGVLRAVRTAEADGRVRYLGRVSDDQLAKLYGAAQAMVYPSFYEGFGLPVAEAMACGCPVLCSWSSSLPEVGGRAALYFRRRDPAHLASQLARMLADQGRLDKMRADGIAQAGGLDFDRAARRMLGVLRRAAGRDEPKAAAPTVEPTSVDDGGNRC